MKKNKYIIAILIILVFLILSVFLFTLKDDRKLTFIESIIKEPVLYVEKITIKPINFLKSEFNVFKSKKKLVKELNEKENIEEKYKILKNDLKEKNKEINELKNELNIEPFNDYDVIHANIINRNVGLWYQTLTLDKGLSDNIKENLAVINSSGLIGKTIKVTKHTSTVKLLTSANEMFQVGVLINNDGDNVFGILSSYKDGLFIIRGLSYNKEIKKDSPVTTSGLDNNFIEGIKIGNVVDVKKDNFDLEQIVYVKPSVDFNSINYVSIMRSK